MPHHEPHSPEAQDPLTAFFGPPIYVYSRAQALEDGVLVDVTERARAHGFVYPVALTASVWARVEAIPAPFAWQDIPGRLSDVLFMARQRIRHCQGNENELLFELLLATTENTAEDEDESVIETKVVTLKIVVGPGDEGEPVLTIMLPKED